MSLARTLDYSALDDAAASGSPDGAAGSVAGGTTPGERTCV